MPTSTDAGRRWLTKALHPAEASIKAERAPGKSRYPTTVQEVVSTFVIGAPAGIKPEDTWNLRVVTHTDPLTPTEVYYSIGDGVESLAGTYLNQAFIPAGVDAFAKHTESDFRKALVAFDRACETFRINALSTTGVFVGASMTDQGSIVSSQFVDCTREMFLLDSPASDGALCPMASVWIDRLPVISEATLGQRPYVSDARSGWYAPQKFNAPGHWMRTNDMALRGRYYSDGSEAGENPAVISPSDCIGWPLAEGAAPGVHYWIRLFDDSCSQTFARGLAPTTSFRITVRMALEMGVTPNNTFAAFAADPAPPDDLAYDLYLQIVNQILDAYPSDYNDLGKLWGKIKSVAKRAAGMLDPIAGIAAKVGIPYASVVQNVAQTISGKKPVDEDMIINAASEGMTRAHDLIRKAKAAKEKAAARKAANATAPPQKK